MPSAAISGITSDTVFRIAGQYECDVVDQLPVTRGYRNESHPLKLANGDVINLILFKNEPNILTTIRNADRVSGYLHDVGYPTRYPLDSRILRIYKSKRFSLAGLYNYLPGDTVAWEAYTMKHLKLLGKTMSDMHDTLRGCNAADLPEISDIYETTVDKMEAYYARPGVSQALQAKLGFKPPLLHDFTVLLRACKHLSDRQILHMDFVRGNILYDTAGDDLTISGILDFEKTAFGHPLFDIARTLAFLLVDCKYKSGEKVYKYFLKSGYIRHGNAAYHNVSIKHQGVSKSLMGELIDMFLLYDFYKFLSHNPYENLHRNEHFRRTSQLLIDKGRIVAL